MGSAKLDLEEEAAACDYLVGLLTALLHGERPAPLPAELTWEKIFHQAQRHSVESMAFEAAKPLLDNHSQLFAAWQVQANRNLAQGLVQLGERESIVAALNAAGIRTLPVKGSVIKEMYLQLSWRQMCDLDILIDGENRQKARSVMEQLGYTYDSDGAGHCDDDYAKPPYMYVELHNSLFAEEEYLAAAQYFSDVWERAVPDEKRSGNFRLSPEDEYIYELAHFHKHYLNQGSGIRSVLDIAVYRDRFAGQLNEAYISAEVDKLGMTAFAQTAEELARCWFGTPAQRAAAKSHDAQELEQVVCVSGVYGSRLGAVTRDMQQTDNSGSRMSYFWGRVFLPVETMALEFPMVEKYPFLYPWFWLCRVFRLITRDRGRVQAEIGVIRGKKQ